MNEITAINQLGLCYWRGENGVQRNFAKAVELWQTAVNLGSPEELMSISDCAAAHFNLGCAYINGNGVDKDEKKAKYHWEISAIGGDLEGRGNVAMLEGRAGNIERAVKHHMIGAVGGDDESLDMMRKSYLVGNATKDQYGKALQAYQSYLDAIRSDKRDEAAARRDCYRYY